MPTTQECFEQYWTGPRGNTPSDVLLWTTSHGRAKAGRPARTYVQRLCEDTGCSPEDLPEVMNDRERWREIVRDIRACIFPLCMETNALEKFTNKSAAWWFFTQTFMIRRIVRICDVVDRFLVFDSFWEFSQFLVPCGWVAEHYKS